MPNSAPTDPAGLPADAVRHLPDDAVRRLAVDPRRSVVLEAPAGSGKTRLLVQRYLNLLARVGQPEEILAITFTNKAATEMRDRVLAELAGDGALGVAIRARDQERNWELSSRPDRLKIQTIDSFAFTLARRQPVVCEFVPEALVEDAATLYQDAAHRLLTRMADDSPYADEIADFVAILDNDADRARSFIVAALAKRDQWIDAVRETLRDPNRTAERIGRGIQCLQQSLARQLETAFPADLRTQVATLCRHFDTDMQEPAEQPSDIRPWSLAAGLLLTKQGQPRRQFGKQAGYQPDQDAAKRLAKGIAEHIEIHGLADALHAAQRIPADEIEPEDLAALTAIATALLLAVTDLNDTFTAARAMDFTELALAANRALVLDDLPTELAQALDYRIRHVLVDEFQDTSLSQHHLLAAIVSGWTPASGNTFFAVGDPMQSIYRFRNADLRQFLLTAEHGFDNWPLEHLRLRTNFRSDARLISWCNGVFSTLFGTRADPLHGAVAFHDALAAAAPAPLDDTLTGVRLDVHVSPPDDAGRIQAEAVADRIEAIRAVDGGANIAVLVRARTVLDGMLPVWRRRGIEWRGTDVEPLGHVPIVRDLACLTEVLFLGNGRWSSRSVRLAWLALLRSPLVGLDLGDLERAAENALGEAPDGLSASGRLRWRRLRSVLDEDVRTAQPRARVERIWLRLGGADAYDVVDADEPLARADQFLQLLETQPALARRPADLRRQLDRLFAATEPDEGQIDVMTIHKAKGLEFDHVIVPGMEHVPIRNPSPLLLWRPEGDGLLIAPKTQRGNSSLYDWLRKEEQHQDANELKRLFYVAATRAINSLTLIGAVEDESNGPPRDSMLSLLCNSQRDNLVIKGGDAAKSVGADETAPKRLSRLVDDYAWIPPVTLPSVPQTPALERPRPSPALDTREIVLGDLVHRELRLLATRGLDTLPEPSGRQAVWHLWLDETNLYGSDRDWVAAQLLSQVSGVLADPAGRWLLARHDQGCQEAAFTTTVDGEAARIIVDRSFVLDGCRWIVEYKSTSSAKAGQDLGDLCARYRPQLARYGRALAALDDLPVRTAIYFTAVPQLVELEPATGKTTVMDVGARI